MVFFFAVSGHVPRSELHWQRAEHIESTAATAAIQSESAAATATAAGATAPANATTQWIE